jgi:hypothetical protein
MFRVLRKQKIVPWLLLSVAFAIFLSSCGVVPRFNEDRALGAIETIRDAEEQFMSKKRCYGNLEELNALFRGIPERQQHGYAFRLEVSQDSYFAVATPTEFKERSISLYLDQTGIIRGTFNNGREATAKDGVLLGPGINPKLSPP